MKISLLPDIIVDSVYDIDFIKLKNLGFTNIIFDIDNTLVPHGAKANQKAIDLFDFLKSNNINTCLISNNTKERVEIFNKDVHSNFIFLANKPSSKGFYKALKIMNANKENTIFIGDQIFTDVLGANLAGLHSIMTRPIEKDFEKLIIMKRWLERVVLLFYRDKDKFDILKDYE